MTQEVRSTIPVQEIVFGIPACTNIDELAANIAFLGFPYEHGVWSCFLLAKVRGPEALAVTERLINMEATSKVKPYPVLRGSLVDGTISMMVSEN